MLAHLKIYHSGQNGKLMSASLVGWNEIGSKTHIKITIEWLQYQLAPVYCSVCPRKAFTPWTLSTDGSFCKTFIHISIALMLRGFSWSMFVIFLGGHWNGISAVYDLPYICVLKKLDQSKPTPTALKQCYRYTPKAKMDSVAQLGFSGVRLKIGGICPRRVHTSLLFHVLSQALSAYNHFLAV